MGVLQLLFLFKFHILPRYNVWEEINRWSFKKNDPDGMTAGDVMIVILSTLISIMSLGSLSLI